MVTTTFLEHDNTSFSRVLLSKEVAEIIKHIVKESSNPFIQIAMTGRTFSKEEKMEIKQKFQCSPNCWCKKQRSDNDLNC